MQPVPSAQCSCSSVVLQTRQAWHAAVHKWHAIGHVHTISHGTQRNHSILVRGDTRCLGISAGASAVYVPLQMSERFQASNHMLSISHHGAISAVLLVNHSDAAMSNGSLLVINAGGTQLPSFTAAGVRNSISSRLPAMRNGRHSITIWADLAAVLLKLDDRCHLVFVDLVSWCVQRTHHSFPARGAAAWAMPGQPGCGIQPE